MAFNRGFKISCLFPFSQIWGQHQIKNADHQVEGIQKASYGRSKKRTGIPKCFARTSSSCQMIDGQKFQLGSVNLFPTTWLIRLSRQVLPLRQLMRCTCGTRVISNIEGFLYPFIVHVSSGSYYNVLFLCSDHLVDIGGLAVFLFVLFMLQKV